MSDQLKPITRYDDWSGRGVRRHEKGAYVAFSDYEKRCAEIAALKKELEETQECFSLARGELYAIKTTPTERNGANICGHDRSWITCFGTCMACRAEKAETQAVAAEYERDALKKELEIARGERNAAIQSLKIIMENADIYEQPEDGTRQWCSELSIYLRGHIAIVSLITPDEKRQVVKLLELPEGPKE